MIVTDVSPNYYYYEKHVATQKQLLCY